MAGGLLLGSAVAVLLTAATPAHNPSSVFDDPPSDRIVIDIATVNGSGCPKGTDAVAVSEDNTVFTVTHSDSLARAGGNSDPTASRKNCRLGLVVHVPCGVLRNFDIDTELRVSAGTTSPDKVSFLRMDSTDGDISTTCHMAWKECPAS